MKRIIALLMAMALVLVVVPCLVDDSSTEGKGSATITLNGKLTTVERRSAQ